MSKLHLVQWIHGLGETSVIQGPDSLAGGVTATIQSSGGLPGQKRMFSRRDVEDILWARIPDADIQDALARLTPDRVDGETLRLFVQVLLESGLPIPPIASDVIDCCGTGGSGLPHYNTSTTVAFVLAAGGVRVAKFRDRGLHSASGSTEFLQALGLNAELPPERLPKVLEQSQVAFLSAPDYYPRWAEFDALRQKAKKDTILHYIAPLLNPVLPTFRLVGVSNPEMQKLIGDYLAYHLTTKRAMVVRGPNNLDEVDVTGETSILQVKQKTLSRTMFEPELAAPAPGESHLTHGMDDNLKIFNALVSGEDTASRYHRMVCLNAGAGFCISGRSTTIEDGALLARDLLAGGKVKETLTRCRKVYAELV